MQKEFIFRQLKEHSNVSDTVIENYIDFVYSHKIKDENIYTERHHILPRHTYPEYKDFKIYSWNKARLTPSDHIRAHILLSQVFCQSAFAVSRMCKYNNLEVPDDIFDMYKENLSLAAAERAKDTSWINKDGISKMAKPDVLNDYLNKGWDLGRGTYNGNNGYIWVTDGINYKMVDRDEVPYGWIKGTPLENRIHAYNPETGRAIFVNENNIPDGYVLGNINAVGTYYTNLETNEVSLFSDKDKIDLNKWRKGNLKKGRKYYYDPITKQSKDFFEGEQPNGWIEGNYSQKGIYRTRGRKWYISPDKTKTKMFYPGEQPNDWTPGRS